MIFLFLFTYLISPSFAMSESQARYFTHLKAMSTEGEKASFLLTEVLNAPFKSMSNEHCISLAKILKKTDGTFMAIDKNGDFFSTYNRAEVNLDCNLKDSDRMNRLYVFNTADQRELFFKTQDVRYNSDKEIVLIETEDNFIVIKHKHLDNRVFYVINKNKRNFILSNKTLTRKMPPPIKDLHKEILAD